MVAACQKANERLTFLLRLLRHFEDSKPPRKQVSHICRARLPLIYEILNAVVKGTIWVIWIQSFTDAIKLFEAGHRSCTVQA